MYEVKINTEEIAKQFGEQAEEVVQHALNRLGEYAKDHIFQQSDSLPIDQQEMYKKSLEVTRESLAVVLTLRGPLANRIEQGTPAFDMKPGMLKSPKAKSSRGGGTYLDIPMRHRVTERGSGTKVPKSMRGMVKAAAGRVVKGGRPETLFKEKKGEIQQAMKVSAAAAGMAEAKTFRRVSHNSPKDSWMYPNKEGLKAFEKTVAEVEQVAEQVLADVAKELL